MVIRRTIIALMAAFLLNACDAVNSNESDQPSRTVLVYIMGENGLYWYAQPDLSEMLGGRHDIPSNSRLVVYVDDNATPRIYEITRKGQRIIKQYTEDHNSTDTLIFKEVLDFTKTQYPSDSYALVMWSHGSGWKPAANTPQRTIGVDNGKNSSSDIGKEMEIADMARTLEGFPTLDYILFDACFMQSVEVAYELKDAAHYIIGSPAEIPGAGAPYDKIIKGLFAQPNNPQLICQNYYQYYANKGQGVALSVIKCDQLEALAEMTAANIHYLSTDKSDINTTGLQRYTLFASVSNWCPELFDISHTMYTYLPEDRYTTWKMQLDKAVPFKPTTDRWVSIFEPYGFSPTILDQKFYGGLTLHLPHSKYDQRTILNEAFTKLKWYEAANWPSTGW